MTIPLEDWIYASVASLTLLITLGFGEWLRRSKNWPAEVTRKMIHVSTGILIYFAPLYLSSFVIPFAVGIFFAAVNFVAIHRGLLKVIHASNRKSYGTVYYPLSFSLLTLICWDSSPLVLMCAMVALAFGDGAAGIVGSWMNKPHEYRVCADKKSVEGSFAMGLVCFAGIALTLGIFGDRMSWNRIAEIAFVASVIAVVMEAVSPFGLDNITVPFSAACIVFAMTYATAAEHLLIGLFLATAVSAAAYYLQMLSASGAMGAIVLGTLFFGLGGWPWTLPLLIFFISGSLLSKLGQKQKDAMEMEKGSRRDLAQVFANGGLPLMVFLAGYFYPMEVWFYIFVAICASVTADTWATEIGTFFGGIPRNIINWKQVKPGVSGGITFQGTCGALVGSGLIAFTAIQDLKLALTITLCGLFGSLWDSLLGAAWQAQYECAVCGISTERKNHCESWTTRRKGFAWMDNDAVNVLGGATGGLTMFLFLNF